MLIANDAPVGRPAAALALSVCVWVSSPAGASAQSPQTGPGEAPTFATSIVVTPERGATRRTDLTAPASVLDAAGLLELPATCLGEVLSFLPGFTVARPEFYAGYPVVSARGFFGGGEADYVALLVDGVPAADVESGLMDWSRVGLATIGRIEASRGPGAAVYGDSAVGGVIQVLSAPSATHVRATATAGSFDTFTADGSWGRLRPGLGFTMSGVARRTSGGFAHSAARDLLAAGSLDAQVRQLAWRWMMDVGQQQRQDSGPLSRDAFLHDPYASDPLYGLDEAHRRQYSTAFSIQHAGARWTPKARVFASWRDEDRVRTIALLPGVGDRQSRHLVTGSVGGSIETGIALPAGVPVQARFGLDLSHESLDTAYRAVDAAGAVGPVDGQTSGSRMRAGGFVSASWRAIERVRVTGALRFDGVHDGGFAGTATSHGSAAQAWSPRAGGVVRVSDRGAIDVFGQVSRAFKVPTLDQRYDPRPFPDFSGGSLTISNPGLLPQHAAGIEGGVSGGSRIHWRALAYRTTVANEIDFDVRSFSYGNIGQSRHTGLEADVEGRWTRVQVAGTYAFAQAVDAETGRRLKNVPHQVLTLSVSVNLPWSSAVYARYRRASGSFLDDENAYPLQGPSTFDLRVRRTLGRASLVVDALNLGGDVYEEYGFTLSDFRGRVTPYVYPGAPRAVRVGITLGF